MKKSFIFFLLAASSLPSMAACTITFLASTEIKQAIEYKGFIFSNFNQVCEKLKKANARILFGGGFYTIDGRNVSAITAQLIDLKSPIASTNFTVTSVVLNDKADDKNRLISLSNAVNNAMKTWSDIDDSIAELNNNRKQIRK
jgi:hypothetical protein